MVVSIAAQRDGVEARAGALVVAERLVAALHRLDITALGGTVQSAGGGQVWGRLDPIGRPSPNDRNLRIPAGWSRR